MAALQSRGGWIGLRTTMFLVALGLLVSMVGCVEFAVSTDYDPQTSFAGLETYAWIPGKQDIQADPTMDGDLLDRRIRLAVDAELRAKGYRESETPDFRVGYHALIREKVDAARLNSYYGYERYRVGPTYAYVYREGTLIVDVVDPDGTTLLWRASVQDVVERSATPEERERRLREYVRRMLERFPPKN